MRRIVLTLVMCAAATTVPAGAETAPTECGGAWTESATCSFVYTGGGLVVWGGARGMPDAFMVRIEAPPLVEGAPGAILLSCQSGSTFMSGCVAVSSGTWIDVAPGAVLTCTVRGTPGGTYGCDGDEHWTTE